ncbi:MFS transporter [Crossiella cryophila]|uniref:Putative MFS transporter n=1 Tax=Crossiella cryophila TaxID=43355 RepID=A0A7W7CEB4_9PSEU|nr:MFS transporter [Crossiella cryophila]MBB4679617.1 putative MFS transporter [Crossiella cryophila]
MSVALSPPTRPYRAIMVAGAATTIICSIVGFFRAFLMDTTGMSMPGMTAPGDSILHGMPLAEMPEMFLAGAGILATLAAALWQGTARAPAATTTRGRPLVALVATAALAIDISKTSTLGFVIPGMRLEYGITPQTASLLAVGGLAGTATGALLFTRLAERIGRRNSYLIAVLAFTATSMCGCMPTFTGNVVMCFLMGTAVGGLAPLLITMLADLFPGGARGPVVAGLSMVATAIGYLIASGSALWLEPTYGWRVLWLIGAPTGLLLVLATFLVPDRTPTQPTPETRTQLHARTAFGARLQWLYAATVGLLTFGLTTWVPSLARASGLTLTTANALLTAVAVLMVPCAVLLALIYRRTGPIPLAVRLALCTAALLLALTTSGLTAAVSWLSAAVLAASLFAVNTMAAVFLPIAADLADPHRRGRATGTVSFFNRLGGLTGPVVLALIVSSVTDVLLAVAGLALLCGAIAWYTGRRHRAAVVPEPEPQRPSP